MKQLSDNQAPGARSQTIGSDLSVGVPILDEQHQKILALIDELASYPHETIDSEPISEILPAIVDHILKHFDTEETFLRSTDIAKADLDRVIKEHSEIAEFLIQLQYRAISQKVMTAAELHEKLREAIISHLTASDSGMRKLTVVRDAYC
jgi:hemerythrin-like metal-binding protein